MHAAGVRRQRRDGVSWWERLGNSTARRNASEPVAQVLKVLWAGAQTEHFLDHRQEIGEGTNRAQAASMQAFTLASTFRRT